MANPRRKMLDAIGKVIPLGDSEWLFFFNKWYIGSTFLAIVFAGLALWASNGIRTYSERLGKVQARQIADANERAAKADERASNNEKEAARLGKLAADEQLARLKLEAEIQPRTLSVKQQEDFAYACLPFKGHALTIFSYTGDTEAARLGLQIANALRRAGVAVQVRVNAMMIWNGIPGEGVAISSVDLGLAGAIRESLIAAHIVSTINPRRPDEKEMTVTVGVKPFELLK